MVEDPDSPHRVDLKLNLLSPTPRKVLEEIERQWDGKMAFRLEGDVVCVVEKRLLNDPTWPLNLAHVPGFHVVGVSFEDLCERAVSQVNRAAHKELGTRHRWVLEVNQYSPMSDYTPDNLPWAGPITVEVRAASARGVLWQVAATQKACFWGVDARVRREGETGEETRECNVNFGGWGDYREKPVDELIELLWSDRMSDRYIHPIYMEQDIVGELAMRGAEGAEALVKSFEATDSKRQRDAIFWYLSETVAFPQEARVVREFAFRQLRSTQDEDVAEGLRHILALCDKVLQREAQSKGKMGGADKGEGEEERRCGGCPLLLTIATGVALCILVVWFIRKRFGFESSSGSHVFPPGPSGPSG
ncbi:hypothetical protein HQ576_20400 [bacterium]|nr:hypothetical protein [bacterium]